MDGYENRNFFLSWGLRKYQISLRGALVIMPLVVWLCAFLCGRIPSYAAASCCCVLFVACYLALVFRLSVFHLSIYLCMHAISGMVKMAVDIVVDPPCTTTCLPPYCAHNKHIGVERSSERATARINGHIRLAAPPSDLKIGRLGRRTAQWYWRCTTVNIDVIPLILTPF